MRLTVLFVTTIALSAVPTPLAVLTGGGTATIPTRSPASATTSECVRAAVAALTLDDAGRAYPAARWPGTRVDVHVTGPAATPAALAQTDHVLTWLTATTGHTFALSTDATAPLAVWLAAGAAPQAVVHLTGHDIVAAQVQWDPTVPHGRRWAWEELLHAAGPGGDHGPPGSVLSVDQTAMRPSAFDRWVLAALYRTETLDTATLTAQLAADAHLLVAPTDAASTVAGVAPLLGRVAPPTTAGPVHTSDQPACLPRAAATVEGA